MMELRYALASGLIAFVSYHINVCLHKIVIMNERDVAQ